VVADGPVVLVVDDALADPHAVAAAARELAKPLAHPKDFYPGVRYPLPEEFHQSFAAWLSNLLGKRVLSERNGYVSMVTTPAAALLPIQTIPHFDTTDEEIWAAVLYLFEGGFGGTSFYRHRATGIELLTRQNEPLYRSALRRDVADPAAVPRRYMNGDTPHFERIHRQEPRFNRLILYPGRRLHAGDIEPEFTGSEGRLTITALFRVK
jgi:hypothetical protein